MDLELIERRRESHVDRFGWQPFERSEYFNPGWWNDPLAADDAAIYIQARLDGIEVARVELDPLVDISHIATAPRLDNLLEIEFLEVASTHRGRAIGTGVVEGLIARYPSRRFVAFSAYADEFWESLGWECYEHPDGTDYSRPLYVQPE